MIQYKSCVSAGISYPLTAFALATFVTSVNAQSNLDPGTAAMIARQPPPDRPALTDVFTKLSALQADQAKLMDALARRAEEADKGIELVLAPETLTRPGSASQSKAKIQKNRALTSERLALLRQFLRETEQLIQSSKLSTANKNSMIRGQLDNYEPAIENLERETNLNLAMFDAMQNIVSLTEKYPGTMYIDSKGALRFKDQEAAGVCEKNVEMLRKIGRDLNALAQVSRKK